MTPKLGLPNAKQPLGSGKTQARMNPKPGFRGNRGPSYQACANSMGNLAAQSAGLRGGVRRPGGRVPYGRDRLFDHFFSRRLAIVAPDRKRLFWNS